HDKGGPSDRLFTTPSSQTSSLKSTTFLDVNTNSLLITHILL
ncbi:MAG: hypothetical protein ACI9S7_000830, partial [Candidatus Paceibacteria bacterium]